MALSFKLIARETPSLKMQVLVPIIVTVLTLLSGLAVFVAIGVDVSDAFQAYFIEPLSTINGISEWLLKALPLCLVALGLAVAYRANVWNIGAEGQLIMGGIFATSAMVILQPHIQSGILAVIMLVTGVVGGVFWASLAAWMRTRFNANEILTTLMLVYIAQNVLQYLLVGSAASTAVLQDPNGAGFPQSATFSMEATLPLIGSSVELFEGTRLNVGIFLMVIAVPVFWVLMNKSFIGYQMRVAGLAPAAANYAGFSGTRLVWLAMLISGAMAGLAGALELVGPVGQLQDSWRPGIGFTAIIVAFLGRLNPVGIVIAALLMALLTLGGEALQLAMSLPKSVSSLFQGMLLMFLLAADVLVNYRVVGKK